MSSVPSGPYIPQIYDASDPDVKASVMQAYAQPLDSDLTAIAALSTNSYGRNLLTLANQAALQAAVGSSGGGTWGSITGTLSSQTDLQTALNGKLPSSVTKAELNTAVSDGNVYFVGDGINETIGATTRNTVAATSGNFNAGLNVTGGGSSGTAGLILGSYGTQGGIFVAGTTPSGSNEVFAADSSTTYVNGISTLGLLVGNGSRINITASAVTVQPNTTFQNNLTVSGLIGLGAYTVATLPSASANAGRIAQATDSSVTTWGSIVAGGGSSRVLLFSNGTNWLVN